MDSAMTATPSPVFPNRILKSKAWVKAALLGTLVATHPSSGDIGDRIFDNLMANLLDNDSEEAFLEIVQALIAGADSVIMDLLKELSNVTGISVEALLEERTATYLAALTDKWGHTPSPWKEG